MGFISVFIKFASFPSDPEVQLCPKNKKTPFKQEFIFSQSSASRCNLAQDNTAALAVQGLSQEFQCSGWLALGGLVVGFFLVLAG